MQNGEGRLNGWKSIAGYLGRDRSTVIRWFNERGLPVHSLPGGKSRSVYAIKAEIDAWMRGDGADVEQLAPTGEAASIADPAPVEEAASPPSASPPTSASPPASVSPPASASPVAAPSPVRFRPSWLRIAIALVTMLVLGAFAFYLADPIGRGADAVDPALPPRSQAQLLRAREDIASRSTDQLQHAIATLTRLSRQAPDHAGIHAALAEGYLLAREFGSLPDALALEKARSEAQQVLEKRPQSATALRILGVVTYWRDRDAPKAGEIFRRATQAKPNDPLAHQWYGNILADNGETDAAFREFDAARQLNPGAPYLLADYAWALWSAGREREATALLDDLARRYPTLASVHDCLSVAAFARGDLPAYARHLRARASMRGAPELVSYSRLVDQAAGNRSALQEVMTSRALAQAEAMPDSDHSWAAFVVSSFGDRAALVAILRRAHAHGERWGAFGFTRRIASRWRSDRDVIALLKGLAQPRIEP